jgi:hypothetical protein
MFLRNGRPTFSGLYGFMSGVFVTTAEIMGTDNEAFAFRP